MSGRVLPFPSLHLSRQGRAAARPRARDSDRRPSRSARSFARRSGNSARPPARGFRESLETARRRPRGRGFFYRFLESRSVRSVSSMSGIISWESGAHRGNGMPRSVAASTRRAVVRPFRIVLPAYGQRGLRMVTPDLSASVSSCGRAALRGRPRASPLADGELREAGDGRRRVEVLVSSRGVLNGDGSASLKPDQSLSRDLSPTRNVLGNRIIWPAPLRTTSCRSTECSATRTSRP